MLITVFQVHLSPLKSLEVKAFNFFLIETVINGLTKMTLQKQNGRDKLSIRTEADCMNFTVKLVQRQRRSATHVHHHCISVCKQ